MSEVEAERASLQVSHRALTPRTHNVTGLEHQHVLRVGRRTPEQAQAVMLLLQVVERAESSPTNQHVE